MNSKTLGVTTCTGGMLTENYPSPLFISNEPLSSLYTDRYMYCDPDYHGNPCITLLHYVVTWDVRLHEIVSDKMWEELVPNSCQECVEPHTARLWGKPKHCLVLQVCVYVRVCVWPWRSRLSHPSWSHKQWLQTLTYLQTCSTNYLVIFFTTTFLILGSDTFMRASFHVM